MIFASQPIYRLLILLAWGGLIAPPLCSAAQHAPDGRDEGKAPSGGWRWSPGPESEPDTTGYDALRVELEVEILFESETLLGEALWTLAIAKSPPAAIVFDFSDAMTVSAVDVDGEPAAWAHAADRLTCIPSRPLVDGEIISVRIAYDGHPERGFLLGFAFGEHDGRPVAYTNCEPAAAHTWWPCKDRPDDKFTAALGFTVPGAMRAVSNGVLAEVRPLEGGRARHEWIVQYPIAPYLVSVIATDFVSIEDEYIAGDGRPMPILHFAFPEDLDAARRHWAFTAEAIGFLAGIFGEYPFVREKYGMAEFPWGGAMEHQTLTSMGAYFLHNETPQDWVVVHELAHQWWGDWVGCETWRDIWLNEGFAVYAEALWAEHKAGPDSLRAEMQRFVRPEFEGSVYDPDFIFNATVYRKGAWVLHMLRHILGDGDFFRALRTYGQEHGYGTAVTEDFRAALARANGDDLRWFFDPWVYGEGQPLYGIWWEAGSREGDGRYLNRVRIVQETSGPQYFTMPLDALFLLPGGGEFRTVLWDSLPEQEFLVVTPAAPESLVLDPDGWVLCRIFYNAVPSRVDEEGPWPEAQAGSVILGRPRPNPTRGLVEIPLETMWQPSGDRNAAYMLGSRGSAARAGSFELDIYDSEGRWLRRVSLSAGSGDERVFRWDGTDRLSRRAAPGVYYARLSGWPWAAERGGRGEVRILLVR